MPDAASLQDVFRFIHLRPERRVAVEDFPLLSSQWSMSLAALSAGKRVPLAEQGLRSAGEVVRALADLALGGVIWDALAAARTSEDATVADFIANLPEGLALRERPGFTSDLERLSDTLLLAHFARRGRPAELETLRDLFKAYLLIRRVAADPAEGSRRLERVLSGPIRLPDDFRDEREEDGASGVRWPHPMRAVGVADLMVVRQHIKRYDLADIAHIENIMPFETRRREHRRLLRDEETTTFESERTVTEENELETTDRFELNRETERTIKEDQKFGFDLNISGKYGPTVEFQTGMDVEVSRSLEETSRNSSTFAQDVMQRSLERVEERVRRERVRKVLRESEETNLHAFTNEGPERFRGIYQFVEKVYEAQVFNYGRRLMFDFVVPEPASYLWHLKRNPGPGAPDLPTPPDPLEVQALELQERDGPRVRERFYARLAAKYGATGITPPPPSEKTVTVGVQVPTTGSEGSSEEGWPGYARLLSAKLPEGYRAVGATINAIALTDNLPNVRLAYSFQDHGNIIDPNDPPSAEHRSVVEPGVGGSTIIQFHEEVLGPLNLVLDADAELKLAVLTHESANHVITARIRCERTQETLDAWKHSVYEKILTAYQDRLLEFRDEMSRIRSEMEQQQEEHTEIGLPPARRKQIIMDELKKHAIAMLTQRPDSARNLLTDRGSLPPAINFAATRSEGPVIRFFEHAIEWNQIQYALYPYFWGDRDQWAARFVEDDPDYEFQQFLQAGAARVVFPVRPGFEAAMAHFLETGEVWLGEGEPVIGDPLYFSIVEEIRAGTGGDEGEATPVGDPWDVRIPTSLIMLRADEDLPRWRRESSEEWAWEPELGD